MTFLLLPVDLKYFKSFLTIVVIIFATKPLQFSITNYATHVLKLQHKYGRKKSRGKIKKERWKVGKKKERKALIIANFKITN